MKEKDTGPKMILAKYLEVKPQGTGVTTLLRRYYSMEAMTISEWDKAVRELLKRKVV